MPMGAQQDPSLSVLVSVGTTSHREGVGQPLSSQPHGPVVGAQARQPG